MTLAAALLADPATRAALTADLLEPASAEAVRLAASLAASFGGSTAALIHYGSHAQRSGAKPESAYDFFVIVRDYGSAYRALARSNGTAFRPALAAQLNRILPPNVIAVRASELTPPPTAKCAVLSLADLALATSPRARDHFAQGRLFQHAQLAWARDGDARAAVLAAVAACRAQTIDWSRAFLPPSFDAAGYIRALLRCSYAAEIRPEGSDRIDALTGAQRDVLAPVYDEFLQRLVALNVLRMDGVVYHLAVPATRAERRRWERYFRRSKRRATLRWGKYILLYDNWLDYVVRKVARRSGTPVELTVRERRWPLLFLWPRVIRYLRSRPQRRR